MAEPQHKKYGMTREQLANLDDNARAALTSQVWVTLPCEICQKPVIVQVSAVEGDNRTWCLQHAGTWKKEAAE